jgi:hypothetical protein
VLELLELLILAVVVAVLQATHQVAVAQAVQEL